MFSIKLFSKTGQFVFALGLLFVLLPSADFVWAAFPNYGNTINAQAGANPFGNQSGFGSKITAPLLEPDINSVPAASTPNVAMPTSSSNSALAMAATPQVLAIQPPKGLMAKPGGDKVLLAWEPVPAPPGAKIAYQVFRSESMFPDFKPGDTLPEMLNPDPVVTEYFLDAAGNSRIPPEPGKTYYYAVMTIDNQGNKSSLSRPVQIVNVSELAPPTGLEGKAGDKIVDLSWVPSFSSGQQELAGYMVYRSDKEGDAGQPLFSEPLNTDKYHDQGTAQVPLTNGQTYYYTLYSQDKSGLRSQPAGPIAVMPFISATVPQGVTATGKADDLIEVRWAPSEPGSFPLKGYNVYRQSDQETEAVKINKELCTGNTFLDSEQSSVSKPMLGRYYTYSVRAVDDKSLESPDSSVAKAGPRPPLEVPRTGLLSTSIPGLPPDSSLTISGRKKIDVSYTMVQALNVPPLATADRYPSITSGLTKGFNLDQQLQVRLEGKVGKKITVDVDYDDTIEEQRKISIIYAGDPDEVIQEAAFGDILLDLPRTEFAGYNKNLFGASVKVAYKDFSIKAIGAQTKGITVTEDFKGNTSRRILDKDDMGFVAYRYYYLTKDWPNQVNHPDYPTYYNPAVRQHGIVPGSEKVYITNNVITTDTITVTNTAQGITYRFNHLSPGVDYSVDYDRGVVTFVSAVQPTWLISVAYKYYDGNGIAHSVGFQPNGVDADFTLNNLQVPVDGKTSDTAHLIQNYNSVTNSKDYRMMVMNYYSLGYQNIMDPQSDHDFVLKIFYANGQEYAPQVPQPTDTQNALKYYRIDPNFGTIQFTHSYPFQQRAATDSLQFLSDNYSDTRNDAYNTIFNPNLTAGVDSTNAHQFNIHVEFKNLITTFQLAHLGIIKSSEIIKKDGAKLQRNTDYYIDYDIGLVTFLNPESIASSTDINVTYEYLPFGGKYQSNLFGARAQYDMFNKKLSVGSTFLYNASQAPQDIPDIRSTPSALSLIDGDVKLSLNPSDFGDVSLPWLGTFNVPVTMDVSAETAYSSFQTNTFRMAGEDGVAMIDSMEGSDNVLALPTDNNAWFPSSNPSVFTNPAARHYIAMSDAFETGHNPVDSNDKLHQLRWNYSNLASDSWDGFVYPISTTGTNLHTYQNIDMWIKVPPSPSTTHLILRVDLGVVSEDSNGNGRLNFEGDTKTLASGTDIGIANYMSDPYQVPPKIAADPSGPQGVYSPNYPSGYWGANNNRLNTEDLDGNGQLDQGESYYEYEVPLAGQNYSTSGWQLISIPVTQFTRLGGANPPNSNPQDPNFLGFIKHIRMWVNTDSTIPSSGYLQFETIQITGNKWQAVGLDQSGNPTVTPATNTINASTISLNTDPGYQPNTNFYIYDQTDQTQAATELKNEKSLKIEYNLDKNAVVSATNTMPAFYVSRSLSTTTLGYDYSGYRYLRVDIYKRTMNNPGEKLFIRLGLDPYNYYHYEVPLDEAPLRSWYTYTIELDGSDGKRTDYFASNILSGLSKINEVSISITNPGMDPNPAPTEIWVNNLRVTGAKSKEGMAYRVSTNTRVSDIFSVSTDYRDVGSDFYMIDESPAGKQHVTTDSVRSSITKLPFLPVNLSWTRSASYTEAQHRNDPSYSNNYSQPDIITETTAGDIAYNQIQGLDLSLSGSKSFTTTDYVKTINNVDNLSETSHATPRVTYSLPSSIFNLPIGSTILSGKYDYNDTHTKYNQDEITELLQLGQNPNLWDRWEQTKDETYTYDGNYSPIPYIRISPSFTYEQSSDRGFLSWYRFYSALDTTINPDNSHYFSDIYRMSKINKIAKLNVNFLSLPVISPSISYNMTNLRDYISDTLSTPGTLSLQSGVDFGSILGWDKFPRFNLSQAYTTSATYTDQYGQDPISKIDFQHAWVIDPSTFKKQDDLFNQATLNSKNFTENASTSLNLFSSLNFTPQYSDSWTRRMTSQDNFQTTTTVSLGSGMAWTAVPSIDWLLVQSLNLDYRFSQNSTFDTTETEINRNTTYTTTLSIPFKFLKEISSTLTAGVTTANQLSGTNFDVEVMANTYTGGLSMAYNLHMDSPIQLPNFWPFNGLIIKLQQTLRLTNSFNVELDRNTEVGVSGNLKSTDSYTDDMVVNYSLWKNVEGDITLTNQWYFVNHDIDANKDYWAIRLKAGLTAIF